MERSNEELNKRIRPFFEVVCESIRRFSVKSFFKLVSIFRDGKVGRNKRNWKVFDMAFVRDIDIAETRIGLESSWWNIREEE